MLKVYQIFADKFFMSGIKLRSTRTFTLIAISLFVSVSFSFGDPAHGVSAKSTRAEIGFKTGSIDTSAEQDFLNRTNSLRASLGLGALHTNGELLAKARSWSQTQADAGTIFHSTLTNGVTQNWHRLGENVGMGPDSASIHDALVRSPRHYENLVDSGFTEVGIGVVRQGNIIYVSQVFMEFMPSNTTQTTSPPTTYKSNTSTAKVPAVAAASAEPVGQAAPLKTASADLSAVIEKLSALEA